MGGTLRIISPARPRGGINGRPFSGGVTCPNAEEDVCCGCWCGKPPLLLVGKWNPPGDAWGEKPWPLLRILLPHKMSLSGWSVHEDMLFPALLGTSTKEPPISDGDRVGPNWSEWGLGEADNGDADGNMLETASVGLGELCSA